MSFISSFNNVFGGADSGVPCALKYRIGVLFAPVNQAVLQLTTINTNIAVLFANADLRDDVLNRILERELSGLPLSAVNIVIGSGAQARTFRPDVDIHDYTRRGNVATKRHEKSRRGKPPPAMRINRSDVYLGRSRVVTSRHPPEALPESVAELLASE